jgi:hypothetical protein
MIPDALLRALIVATARRLLRIRAVTTIVEASVCANAGVLSARTP